MGAVGLLMYIEMIYSFPPEITMYNGQPASSRLGAGISIGNIPENACVYTGKNTVTPVADGEYNATLKIGAVSYRKVRLRVTKPQSVCASGSLIGLRIYNNGLIVLGTQRIETAEGTASPAADAGICEGDIITKINGSFPAEGRDVGKLLRDGAVPMMGTELEELQKGNDSDVKPNVMLDFLVPIMILVGTAIWTYIAKGGVKILECFIITVIYMSIELSIRKVFKSVTDLVSTAVQGMKSVMSATLILALAYCINTITKSMGAADFLLGVCESWMTPALFLSVTFIAGAVISFFTGSSWGTFAICIPIAVPMAYSFTGGQLGTLVYAAVGAVVSGGLFGDHCSPVSDTSVLSSLGAACDHIDHVRTQLPYALLAAAVSIILWVVVALVGGAA